MNIKYLLIILILINILKITTVSGIKWNRSVTQEIIKLNPYHLTIITMGMKITNLNENMKELPQSIPTVSLTLKEMRLIAENTPSAYTDIAKSYKARIYLIFYDDDINENEESLETLQYFFYYFDKLYPVQTRPKCLIVISTKNSIRQDSLGAILRYAWTMKFLDVTILTLLESNESNNPGQIIHYYNPFTVEYHSETWDSKSTLFPNKRVNMNGYPMKTCTIHLPPFIEIRRNSDGSVKEIAGTTYKYTTFLYSYLNFSIVDIAELSAVNTSAAILEYKRLLDDATINTLPIPIFSSIIYNQRYEFGIFFEQTQLVTLVPIIQQTRVNIPASLFNNIFIGISFYIAVTMITHWLKFERRYWNFTEVIRLFLGASIPQAPQKPLERLVFICTILLTMTYFNTIFSNLMNINIITEHQKFDTWEAIANSNLNIFIEEYAINLTLPLDDKLSQKIRSKLVKYPNVYECVRELRKNRNHICFVPQPRDKLLMEYYNYVDHPPIMKIGKIKILFDWQMYVFERASPYVDRFDEILSRIIESGVSTFWHYKCASCESAVDKTLSNVNPPDQGGLSVIQLVSILLIGYTASFIAFGLELWKMHILKARSRHIIKQITIYRVTYD